MIELATRMVTGWQLASHVRTKRNALTCRCEHVL
jgi:hypothetical protein